MTAFDGQVGPPDFVSVETTRFCNLRCRMCVQYNDGTTVSGPHMPLEEFRRIAEQVFPLVSRWQPSVAGEPMMSQGFDEMVETAQQHGVKAEIYTNATLLNSSRIRLIAENLGNLTVSFDGATPETFEHIREGAKFQAVRANIKSLVAYARTHLPADRQPRFGLNFVMMESNIRELPHLIRMAAQDLGIDFVACAHVFPITDEMKQQSLARHQDLAIECIEEACKEAQNHGIELIVDSLDQVTIATALSSAERAFAQVDGSVERLGHRHIGAKNARSLPRSLPEVQQARNERRLAATPRRSTLTPRKTENEENGPASMLWCDFLWNKTYAYIGGDIRPCCMHGAPVAGNLNKQDFLSIWNGPVYRQMRQRLAAGTPVPFCRGCTHLRTLTDSAEIAQALEGCSIPSQQDLDDLVDVLDPSMARRRRVGSPPVLEWPRYEEAIEYVVECSLDKFHSLLFTTEGDRGGPRILEPKWQVPAWAWREAPPDLAIWWRVIAIGSFGRIVAGEGMLPAQET